MSQEQEQQQQEQQEQQEQLSMNSTSPLSIVYSLFITLYQVPLDKTYVLKRYIKVIGIKSSLI